LNVGVMALLGWISNRCGTRKLTTKTTYTTDKTGCSTSCGTDDFLSFVNGGCLESRGDIELAD
jgi:hypothetical protein